MNVNVPPPPVTVVIPVFNGMPYLPEAVASILGQSFRDFALLIVDDGSSDGSTAYAATIADPRVEVVGGEHRGLCETLNSAYRRARSPLVARLDQDDLALPERLAEQVGFLAAHPDHAGVFGQVTRIGRDGRDFGAYLRGTPGAVESYDPAFDRHFSIVHSASCFRRERVLEAGGYREVLYPVDDYDLVLRLLERAKLAVLNRPLVKYRIHGGAATFGTFKEMQVKARFALAMHERRVAGAPEVALDEFRRTIDRVALPWRAARGIAEYGMLLFRRAGMHLGEGRRARGLAALGMAVALNPRFALRRLWSLRRS